MSICLISFPISDGINGTKQQRNNSIGLTNTLKLPTLNDSENYFTVIICTAVQLIEHKCAIFSVIKICKDLHYT